MNRLCVAFILCLSLTGHAWAHGKVAHLPDSVQITQYRLSLFMDPDNLAVRNNLALALYRTNQLEEAQEELKYILEKDSANFDALDAMGIVLLRMGKYQEALEYLKKAVKVNERDVMVHVHLSVAYEKLESAEKARGELDKARSLSSAPAELENIKKELKMVRGK